MLYSRVPVDTALVRRKTLLAQKRRQGILELASAVQTDVKATERVAQNLCVICFYGSDRIAGQAITQQPCGLCGTLQTFPSTATDALCQACAREHALCKRCVADLDLNAGRSL